MKLERLTTKTDDKLYPYKYLDVDDCMQGTPINKLGQHEDIEERYGIDLITLVNAMASEIYWLSYDGSINRLYNNEYWLSNSRFGYGFKHDKGFIFFDDYGKIAPGGWALTREALQ